MHDEDTFEIKFQKVPIIKRHTSDEDIFGIIEERPEEQGDDFANATFSTPNVPAAGSPLVIQ